MADDNKIAVSVKSLTKVYPLYQAPKDRLKETLHPLRKKYHKEFYALRDVSFDINKGDSLGIVGQNGSGKSTLLKILTGVLTPTSGHYYLNGLVISLLELGSGFNPELTGMENIYFYGTMLGFSKKQLDEKLDGILSFADIGQFIYQPMKTYSTGMRARLAFSVASNVDPEILILDEVLSVGDIRFQQKCFRVMQNNIDKGNTIILVSHSTGAVINFCNKTMWLHEGQIKNFGTSTDVIKEYISFMTYGLESQSEKKDLEKNSLNTEKPVNNFKNTIDNNKLFKNNIEWIDVRHFDSFGEHGAIIEAIAIYFKDSLEKIDVLRGGEWISIYAKIDVKDTILNPALGLLFKDRMGNGVFTVNNYQFCKPLRKLSSGEKIIIRTDIKFPNLRQDQYMLTIALSDGNQDVHVQHHWIHDAFIFTVNNTELRYSKGAAMLVLDMDHYDSEIISPLMDT